MCDLKTLVQSNLPEGPAAAVMADGEQRKLKLIQLLANPVLYVIPFFLLSEEASHLLEMCAKEPERWKPATPIEEEGTSEIFALDSYKVTESIARSIAQLLDVDPSDVEDVRIERYLPGQYKTEFQDNRGHGPS